MKCVIYLVPFFYLRYGIQQHFLFLWVYRSINAVFYHMILIMNQADISFCFNPISQKYSEHYIFLYHCRIILTIYYPGV